MIDMYNLLKDAKSKPCKKNFNFKNGRYCKQNRIVSDARKSIR